MSNIIEKGMSFVRKTGEAVVRVVTAPGPNLSGEISFFQSARSVYNEVIFEAGPVLDLEEVVERDHKRLHGWEAVKENLVLPRIERSDFRPLTVDEIKDAIGEKQ